MSEETEYLEWLPVIESGSNIKYAAIVEAISRAIESGQLTEGTRLPPHRDLAERLGVTVATVTKAITDLNRRGLVTSRRGSGTYVCATRRARTTPEPIVGPKDLAVNRPPVGPVAELLSQALAEVGSEHDSATLFGYEPIGGALMHRQAGAAWLAERGIEVDAEQVIVTQGANDGLLTALAAVCRPDDTILCEAVNYSGLRRIAHLLGLNLAGVAIDDKGMLPDALAEACHRLKPRAVVCTPVTHNPTGATLDGSRRRRLANVVRNADVVLIEDDINGHLAAMDAETLFGLAPEQTVYVTSMSKCVSAGLRVGFMTASQAMLPRLRDALYSANWTAPSLHAAIATQLIVSGGARQCVDAQRREAAARMAVARKCLGERVPSASAAYHVWITIDRSIRPEALCMELIKENILISPAHHFAVPGCALPNAIRIGLGSVESRSELEAALQVISAQLSPQTLTLGAIA